MKSLLKNPLFYGIIYLIIYLTGYIILTYYNYTYFGIVKTVSIIVILIIIVLRVVMIFKIDLKKKNKLFTPYFCAEIIIFILLFLSLGYFLGFREREITLYNKKMVEVRYSFLNKDTVFYYDYVNPFIRKTTIKKKVYYDQDISQENYLSTDFYNNEGNLIGKTYSQNLEEEIEILDVKSGSYNSTTVEAFLDRILYEKRFNKTDVIRVRVTDSILAGRDIIVVEKSTDNGISYKNILENNDKYLIVNRDTSVTFVNNKIGFIFDLGLLGRDDRYKKFLATTDGGKTFSDVTIKINGYGTLDYYYINKLPYLEEGNLVLEVSVLSGENLKDIKLSSNDGLTFSN